MDGDGLVSFEEFCILMLKRIAAEDEQIVISLSQKVVVSLHTETRFNRACKTVHTCVYVYT